MAHNVFGVAQTINSANFVYFEALQRTLKLGHPDAVNIYTSECLKQVRKGEKRKEVKEVVRV